MAQGRTGLMIKATYAELGDLARRAEDAGFSSVWVSETKYDSIVQASVLVQATKKVDVGTNITLAFPRSPTVTAMQAWDLADLSGDRFVLGLGSQVKRIIEERFSADFDQPAKRMAEYVQAMRAVWQMERGEDVTFEGDIYRVLRPGLAGLGSSSARKSPPVCVAAVGPLMTRAAATYADGLLGHPFTSVPYLRNQVIPRMEEARAESGRSHESFRLVQGIITSISDDREQARWEARRQIAFYGTTPNYREVFASCGEAELTDVLRDVWTRSKQDPEALAEAVPDAAVDRYAIAGTPDEARDRLKEVAPYVDDVVLGSVWWQTDRARMTEINAAIIDTFSTTS